MDYHTPVLLEEAISYLKVKRNGLYIDATVGGGGHAQEIIEKGGLVLGIDRDPNSIRYLTDKKIKNLKLVNTNFSHIYKAAQDSNFNQVDGILFDLGVSSRQLNSPDRGFSFQNPGPLDMRMDPTITITAYDLINNIEKRRLNEIFKEYGEEKLSWSISEAIDSARKLGKIRSTLELAQIISEVYRKKQVKSKLHAATKVFQALRIVVNSELLNLEEALPQTKRLLKQNGRLVVISFHSLEDGIVKRFLNSDGDFKTITKKPIGPSNQEVEQNPRARSAKLRAAEKM